MLLCPPAAPSTGRHRAAGSALGALIHTGKTGRALGDGASPCGCCGGEDAPCHHRGRYCHSHHRALSEHPQPLEGERTFPCSPALTKPPGSRGCGKETKARVEGAPATSSSHHGRAAWSVTPPRPAVAIRAPALPLRRALSLTASGAGAREPCVLCPPSPEQGRDDNLYPR